MSQATPSSYYAFTHVFAMHKAGMLISQLAATHNVPVFFSNDILWDGQQCPGVEAPCCTHPNMPWFNKTLSNSWVQVATLQRTKLVMRFLITIVVYCLENTLKFHSKTFH